MNASRKKFNRMTESVTIKARRGPPVIRKKTKKITTVVLTIMIAVSWISTTNISIVSISVEYEYVSSKPYLPMT